jgi:hypothetical protein
MMIREPGIYDALPFKDYLLTKAMNFHSLIALATSPLHLKSVLDGHQQPSTEALRFGRAIHCGLLTPDLLQADHPTQGNCVGTIKSGAGCTKLGKFRDGDGDYWCGTHRDKDDEDCVEVSDFVKPVELETIAALNRVIHQQRHPAAELLRGPGSPEQTIVFERRGVLCKARLDWMFKGGFVDLKKKQVGTLSDRDLLRANVDYNYVQQLAFYTAAMASLGYCDVPQPSILYVEDAAPYDMTVMPLDDQSLAIGLAETDALLDRYKHHLETDTWPGVHDACVDFDSGQPRRGGLPLWKREQAVESGLVSEESWLDEPLRGIELAPKLTGFGE